MGEAFAKAAGVSPVPLSIMDVYTQLSASHGSIDTVYNSPFGALAMQWHTKLKYATHVPLTNGIGSLVVSKRFYKKLPPNLQQLLKKTAKVVGKKINRISRRDNKKSIELLKKSGITFMWNWTDEEKQEMQLIRDRAAKTLAESNYIPEEKFTQVTNILKKFRTEKSADDPQ